MQHSYTIHIAGQVQGVGFRPYVFNLAEKHELTGYVSNNERGVVILVQGSEERAREFYAELIENQKQARIYKRTLAFVPQRNLRN